MSGTPGTRAGLPVNRTLPGLLAGYAASPPRRSRVAREGVRDLAGDHLGGVPRSGAGLLAGTDGTGRRRGGPGRDHRRQPARVDDRRTRGPGGGNPPSRALPGRHRGRTRPHAGGRRSPHRGRGGPGAGRQGAGGARPAARPGIRRVLRCARDVRVRGAGADVVRGDRGAGRAAARAIAARIQPATLRSSARRHRAAVHDLRHDQHPQARDALA